MKNQISIKKLSIEITSGLKIESTHFGWQLLPKYNVPEFFPPTFADKIDSVVAITAPTSTGGIYMVYSANRVDEKAKAIDIEPFGLIVHSTGASNWGMFIHHGDWDGRTEIPPNEIWDEIDRSGIGDYYLTSLPSTRQKGSLDELPKGHREGFNTIIKALRDYVDKDH